MLSSQVKEQYATVKDKETIRSEIENFKSISVGGNFLTNVGYRRGSCMITSFDYDSGPRGMLQILKDKSHISREVHNGFSESNNSLLSSKGTPETSTPRIIDNRSPGRASEQNKSQLCPPPIPQTVSPLTPVTLLRNRFAKTT